ncbi:hypothetical protein [Streptomyces sp. NPDC002619]|uniref:hypothetical protein n=1 Tax=Streptomyces sp. NPDC002619 TaxID=3364655 RepID=UPI0036905BA8
MAWNRSPAPVAELVEAGARPAASPGEAVGAPVSFSMRANDIATDPIPAREHFQDCAGGCMSALRPSLLLPSAGPLAPGRDRRP